MMPNNGYDSFFFSNNGFSKEQAGMEAGGGRVWQNASPLLDTRFEQVGGFVNLVCLAIPKNSPGFFGYRGHLPARSAPPPTRSESLQKVAASLRKLAEGSQKLAGGFQKVAEGCHKLAQACKKL